MRQQFQRVVGKIRRAHARLGHRLGWRFLYSPARTFSSRTHIVFVGTNPGGRRYESPSPSVEKGNAYRVEPWNQGKLNALQRQVCAFYGILAASIPKAKAEHLMDTTLAANFVPFRSASWDKLRNKQESINFARKLWAEILALVRPNMIITMGGESTRQIYALLKSTGCPLRTRSLSCGWGAVTYELGFATVAGKKVLLIALPHLSRFGIFDRAKTRPCFTPLARAVRVHMSKTDKIT